MNGGMGSGSTNLGIESLTTGVSKAGLDKYLEDLRTATLLVVSKEINNCDDVISAINNCWQGESRDRFLEAFKLMRQEIGNDINWEFRNLEEKLNSLFIAMYNVDKYGIYDYK